MTTRTLSQVRVQPDAPRFDRQFIEQHQLVERYLENKLPLKGAQELENWCRAHPEYLAGLKLAERAQSSLKLLEASGKSQDLGEPKPLWWKSIYVLIGVGVVALMSLVAFWSLFSRYELLRGELADTRARIDHGPLVQPAAETSMRIVPDRAAGIDRARIILNRSAPQLLDLHIDLGYTNKLSQFRVFVDKKDQGRALVLSNVVKDSNNELRATLNSTGLSAGIYTIRIDAIALRGVPIEVGWLLLDVR